MSGTSTAWTRILFGISLVLILEIPRQVNHFLTILPPCGEFFSTIPGTPSIPFHPWIYPEMGCPLEKVEIPNNIHKERIILNMRV